MADLAESTRGLDRSAVLAFVDQMFGFRPADDDPAPIGPWGPIVRGILTRGPVPEPWDLSLVSFLQPRKRFGGFVLDPSLKFLNPQPLPPLPALMLEALLARAELLADLGKATGNEGAAVDFVRMMVDDLCPPPWRFPIPKPKGGEGDPPPRPDELVLDASGLLIIGAGLRSAAAWTAHASLATALVESGLRAADVALETGFG